SVRWPLTHYFENPYTFSHLGFTERSLDSCLVTNTRAVNGGLVDLQRTDLLFCELNREFESDPIALADRIVVYADADNADVGKEVFNFTYERVVIRNSLDTPDTIKDISHLVEGPIVPQKAANESVQIEPGEQTYVLVLGSS